MCLWDLALLDARLLTQANVPRIRGLEPVLDLFGRHGWLVVWWVVW